jgi:cytochrome c
MKIPNVDFSFVWVIYLCGVFALLFIGANLAVLGLNRHPSVPEFHLPGADVGLGRKAAIRHGCGGCHVIPGIPGATGRVGPSLSGIREQMFLAGALENSPQNLAIWIRSPQGISPHSAMPNLGLTEDEARDIAAFLIKEEHLLGRIFRGL